MTAKPKTAALSVVDRDPGVREAVKTMTETDAIAGGALPEVERAMEEIGREQRPMIQRAESRRQRIAQEAREVEGLLHDLAQREALLERLVEAARRAIAQQREDLEEELALLHHGLVGAAPVAPAAPATTTPQDETRVG